MDTQQKVILVVEDEKQLSQALHEKLSHEGFGVLVAFDGKEGLAIALEKHPDLILLDLVMPTMDGISMLKLLRQDDWGSGVPTIILSNLTDAEKLQASIEAGVFDYLIKADWKLEDVVKKIRDTLKLSV